jgi:hypothetical protein
MALAVVMRLCLGGVDGQGVGNGLLHQARKQAQQCLGDRLQLLLIALS